MTDSLPPMPRIRHLLMLGSMMAIAPAWGAVYGLPEPPTPAPTPTLWLLFSDDFLGAAVLETDDYRTANIGGGGAWGAWRFGLDGSMLTNRGEGGKPPSRTDELTASAGYAVLDSEHSDGDFRSLLVFGLGLRVDGNLGGQVVQDAIHDAAGYDRVVLPYDTQTGSDGFVFAHARSLLVPPEELAPLGLFACWGIQVEAAGFVGTRALRQGYVGTSLVTLGRESQVWLGARFQANHGDERRATATAVAQRESGWWIVGGISREPGVSLSAGFNPTHNAVSGTLGLSFDTAIVRPPAPAKRVDETLKWAPHGGSLGVDLRWQPAWLAASILSPRDTVVLSYDFGLVPAHDWHDDKVDFDQLVVGWSPTWPLPTLPLVCEFTGYAAAGVRLERVLTTGPSPRFARSDIAVAGVAQGELGTRLGWRFDDSRAWYNQLRLGAALDGWLPVPRATARNGNDRDTYMEPGFAAHLTIGIEVNW